MMRRIKETVDFLKGKLKDMPDVLIVLGSSLGSVADAVKNPLSIPYEDIPYFKTPTAHTHSGNVVFGEMGDKNVMVMRGRFHVYEGFDISETTYPVRVAAELGVRSMITTNLSGGIRKDLNVGGFMAVTDHINLSGANPLIFGANEEERKLVDMYEAYDPKLIALLEEAAQGLDIVIRKGVLAYLTGPNFETGAELRMLGALGADAVGWSLVPEVLEARRSGLRSLGIACISDISDPERFGPVDLDHLYESGQEMAGSLTALLEAVLHRI
jgi:purine-nucleoside phosphorylase